ncbi:hypothetical protein [Duganella caerulea]|uniref:hypothetical protein n=1 Tax=Duganella caerulea TaxID=2885762 RepID=UPI004037BF8B
MDRDLFELMVLDASKSSTPRYICDVSTSASNFDRYCDEGRARAAANAAMRGARWHAGDQNTPGHALTVDELGRVGEGAIEELLGIDVAAVLTDATDARPDRTVAGVRFDVKTADVRPGNSFAVPVWRVDGRDYDALLLVQHVEPGLARVWCCKSEAAGAAWTKRPGVRGKGDFYRIECPTPAAM